MCPHCSGPMKLESFGAFTSQPSRPQYQRSPTDAGVVIGCWCQGTISKRKNSSLCVGMLTLVIKLVKKPPLTPLKTAGI